MESKTCSTCGVAKPLDAYYQTNGKPLSRCKECTLARAKVTEARRRYKRVDGNFTPMEWKELCEKYGNQCIACGSKERLIADHITPGYLGGSDNIDNIQPLCLPCNTSKGGRIIDFRISFAAGMFARRLRLDDVRPLVGMTLEEAVEYLQSKMENTK